MSLINICEEDLQETDSVFRQPCQEGRLYASQRHFMPSKGSIEACYNEKGEKARAAMREILPGDLLRELVAVEGRYIQWEWEPQTLTNDCITLREATGYTVAQHDKSGRKFSVHVSRVVVQRLISEHSVYEDELRRASGFRIYRPTKEGRSRRDLRKAS